MDSSSSRAPKPSLLPLAPGSMVLVCAAHVVRALQHDVVVLLVACLAGVVPYLNALRGKMAYDDKVRPRAGCLPV